MSQDMERDLVLVSVEEGVGIVSLNRPERHNALTDELSDAIGAAVDDVFDRPDVRVVLLRGEGKSFCSGRDLSVIGSTKAGTGRGRTTHDSLRLGQARQLKIMNSPKPSICVMRGYTAGAGFELALAADMRIASSDAQMWLPEIRMSVLPDLGGAHILASLIGSSRAKYICMTGDRIDAAQALAWGIVDFVKDAEEIDSYALNLAKRLATMPPIALGFAKELCDGVDGPQIRRGVQAEIYSQIALFGTEDFQEGMLALREKRTPKFVGR